ncbi:hypothetical protein F5050DRAFT_784465 [Lentinula boryana]|uniref:Uncharacterized protein n=1 Tax=Lentinula boryana TaxID=40481 RepID=A0ABQ8Q2V3_9AGAR|nr:hypothetical protein F5050DRAFT_784465 [Lentinula boryana]
MFCEWDRIFIRPTHFALFLALYFASLLDSPCDISTVFGVIGVPTSLPQVNLVTFTRIAHQMKAIDVHLWSERGYEDLVLLTSTPQETLSWFNNECGEPLCLQLADTQCFWVFIRISSKSTNEAFAEDVKGLNLIEVFRDQPEILPLLNKLPNLCLDVGTFEVLRLSGSCWADRATEDSNPREQHPAGVLNLEELDEVEQKLSHNMFMRRLSQAIAQMKTNEFITTGAGMYLRKVRSDAEIRPWSMSIVQLPPRIAKAKRGGAQEIAPRSSNARTGRTRKLRSTNVDVATNSNKDIDQANEDVIKFFDRSQGKVGKLATGRASAEMGRSDELSASSSNNRYNLRTRQVSLYSHLQNIRRGRNFSTAINLPGNLPAPIFQHASSF